MKKAVLVKIVAAAAVALSLTVPKPGRTVAQIKKSKQIKIAVFSDKKPFGYVDENGVYQGYDVYFAERIAKDLLDGRGDAFSTDNTEVLAWAIENPGFTVGIDSLGNLDTINAAVKKGNADLLKWLDDEIRALGRENFFHKDYEATLRDVYGAESDADSLAVEGGQL